MKYTHVITCRSLDSRGCLDQIPSHALANNLMTSISYVVASSMCFYKLHVWGFSEGNIPEIRKQQYEPWARSWKLTEEKQAYLTQMVSIEKTCE